MSANNDFVVYVRELLAPLGHLGGGRFFGGHALRLDGLQFAMVMGNTLYFKVDDHTRPLFERKGAKAFAYTTKQRVVQVRSYFEVPPEVLEDTPELLVWARRAIGVQSAV